MATPRTVPVLAALSHKSRLEKAQEINCLDPFKTPLPSRSTFDKDYKWFMVRQEDSLIAFTAAYTVACLMGTCRLSFDGSKIHKEDPFIFTGDMDEELLAETRTAHAKGKSEKGHSWVALGDTGVKQDGKRTNEVANFEMTLNLRDRMTGLDLPNVLDDMQSMPQDYHEMNQLFDISIKDTVIGAVSESRIARIFAYYTSTGQDTGTLEQLYRVSGRNDIKMSFEISMLHRTKEWHGDKTPVSFGRLGYDHT